MRKSSSASNAFCYAIYTRFLIANAPVIETLHPWRPLHLVGLMSRYNVPQFSLRSPIAAASVMGNSFLLNSWLRIREVYIIIKLQMHLRRASKIRGKGGVRFYCQERRVMRYRALNIFRKHL